MEKAKDDSETNDSDDGIIEKADENALDICVAASSSQEVLEVDEVDLIHDVTKEMALLGLPTEFGQTKRGKLKSISTGQNDSFRYSEALFDRYWKAVGNYLIYRTWMQDYGAHIDEGTRKQMMEEVPTANLLFAHKDLERFANIAYMIDDDSRYDNWEELYERHCFLIFEEVKRDFEMAQIRCKRFIDKVTTLGFVFKSTANSEESDSSDTDERHEDNEKSSIELCKPLMDVAYSMYFKPGRDKFRNNVEPASSCMKKDSQLETREPNREGIVSFDFTYDKKRDAWLVARNARKTFVKNGDITKYWYQRYRLFSRLDEGILMDEEGWFSVTPERIAEHIADRLVAFPDALILDAFCGVGGDSIQLALKGAHVVAIDMDPTRLRCALRNAQIYGVADRITFICTDFFHFADGYRQTAAGGDRNDSSSPFDAVLLSPPWGGPSYLQASVFSLERMIPNGYAVFHAARRLSHNIAYFLPRQTSSKELISLARTTGGRCEIEQAMLIGKVKAITAYYGDLVTNMTT